MHPNLATRDVRILCVVWTYARLSMEYNIVKVMNASHKISIMDPETSEKRGRGNESIKEHDVLFLQNGGGAV